MFLTAIMIFLNCVNVAFAAYYNEGNDGNSEASAYIIDSLEDLSELCRRVNNGTEPEEKYYKLSSDIDLTSERNWPGIGVGNGIDNENEVIFPFAGHFDGQNHTITVNIQNNSSDVGLFCFISISSDIPAVKNLNVEGDLKGNWAGGITWSLNSGIIDNCSFNGNIEAYDWAGGIADFVSSGTIRNCTFNGTIKATLSDSTAGGIAGEFYGDRIEDCRVLSGSEISASSTPYGNSDTSAVGGIVGLMHSGGAIIRSSSEAILNAVFKGGIVGRADGDVSSGLAGNTFNGNYDYVGTYSSSTNTSNLLPSGRIEPVTLTPELINNILESIGNPEIENIRSIEFGNVTEQREPTQDMINAVENNNYKISGKLNSLTVNQNGWYVFKTTLSDNLFNELRGKNIDDIRLYIMNDSENIISNITSAILRRKNIFRNAAINNIGDSWNILSLNGTKLTTLNSNEILMAGFLESGETFSTYIAENERKENELPVAMVEPVASLDNTVIENIARALTDLSTDITVRPEDIKFLTEENLSAPREPSEEMEQAVHDDNYEIIGKFNTITVSEDGYYVFRVRILSDDLWEQLQDQDAEQFRAYIMSDERANNSTFRKSILGVLNTIEILSISGEKISKIGLREFLMAGFLNSGEPLSLYIAKIILSLLLGGCNQGFGILILAIPTGFLTLKFFRRKK